MGEHYLFSGFVFIQMIEKANQARKCAPIGCISKVLKSNNIMLYLIDNSQIYQMPFHLNQVLLLS